MFTVGSIQCETLSDGVIRFPASSLYTGRPPGEVEHELRDVITGTGLVPLPYSPVLLRIGGDLALIDTGSGQALAEMVGAPIGKLADSLAVAGVAADDIRLVLISHAHGDHIGGLTVKDGDGRRPVFRNARHVIGSTEFSYWASVQMTGDDAWIADFARLHLLALDGAGLLDLIDGELEIAPGLRMIPAPGHTPGHMAVAVTEGSDTAYFVGDAVSGELNFAHPDWTSAIETDRDTTVRTRRRLLDEAARSGATVAGYHLWQPGTVQRDGGAYHWTPIDEP